MLSWDVRDVSSCKRNIRCVARGVVRFAEPTLESSSFSIVDFHRATTLTRR